MFDFLAERAVPGEMLARHTTYRVGGPCQWMLWLHNDELESVIVQCPNWRVIGLGSNILVDDKGFDGVVIRLVDDAVDVRGNVLTASAGATLAKVALVARSHGLSGLEWAHGIPSTVGGAVWMNAGAFGGDVHSALVRCHTLDNHTRKCYDRDGCSFGYRTSRFQSGSEVILDASFELRPDDPERIAQRMRDFGARRAVTQPRGRSCGSVFANPAPDLPAALLIERAGLKGASVGAATVSTKHANFIIATDGATARDIRMLIERVRATVLAHCGIRLELELRYLPS